MRRHRLEVLARTPLMGHDVLDVGHPAAVVIAEPPAALEAWPPPTIALDLDGARGIEAALSDSADHHGAGPYAAPVTVRPRM